MITKEQIDKLCGNEDYKNNILAVLTRDYELNWKGYTILKGAIVELSVYKSFSGDLRINGNCVDNGFPYDAAELLE